MSEVNPYLPPQADIIPPSDPTTQPLASPWIRLVAQIVDGLIAGGITAICQLIAGYYTRISAGTVSMLEPILWSLLTMAIILGINWNFLLQGQTIGKKVMKIRIVRKSGAPIDRTRILTHRLLPVWVASVIPFIGGLAVIVDALCIFRSGHNTLHDDIADSKVVTA
jgi:uncharacterized RDD family membrane protein YckC